ncbi:MAG: RNA methyltransferase [Clostridium sp.]|nr:RNA methyltransferase [Clostridium sp.]
MADIHWITDFSAPELDIYARLSEGQLLHYYEPDAGIFIAESPKVIERALDAGYEPLSFLTEPKCMEGEARELLARCIGIPVYTAEFDVLTKLTGYQLTRGLLCAMRRKPLLDIRSLCAGLTRIVILENVMNPTNVGAVFRSAAAMNMDAVLLTPGCSNPLYRRASRVSMGTVFQIPWTFFDEKTEVWPGDGMKILKELGFKTAAMALREDSTTLDDPSLKEEEKLAVVIGTEGDGLASETIADCDYTVRIKMARNVDSLNAASAACLAFWELGKRL